MVPEKKYIDITKGNYIAGETTVATGKLQHTFGCIES